MKPELLASLVVTLARLEDELPYISVEEFCSHWLVARGDDRGSSRVACVETINRAIEDRLLFTDLRQRLDPSTGKRDRVRLVRLNRRHPAILTLLED
jgi:hypothetical protein